MSKLVKDDPFALYMAAVLRCVARFHAFSAGRCWPQSPVRPASHVRFPQGGGYLEQCEGRSASQLSSNVTSFMIKLVVWTPVGAIKPLSLNLAGSCRFHRIS